MEALRNNILQLLFSYMDRCGCLSPRQVFSHMGMNVSGHLVKIGSGWLQASLEPLWPDGEGEGLQGNPWSQHICVWGDQEWITGVALVPGMCLLPCAEPVVIQLGSVPCFYTVKQHFKVFSGCKAVTLSWAAWWRIPWWLLLLFIFNQLLSSYFY